MSYKPKPINLVLPLNNIKEIVQAIDLFNQDWLKYHNSKGLKLYHYTTSNGLKGILDSRSIWCSHIKYFSDPKEWVYGENKVICKIEKLLTKEDEPNIKGMLEDLRMWIRSITNSLYDVYAACFCEKDNLLSQWRGYSNKGGGYSLGFTFNSNTKITYDYKNLTNIKLATFRKVIYDLNTQNQMIDNALDRLIDAGRLAIKRILKTENHLQPGFINQMAMGFANRLTELIICIKDEVFSEESEWRLIIFKSKGTALDTQREVEFREKDGELIPYLPVNVYDETKNENEKSSIFPLSSIRIGPSLDSRRVKHSLELLTKKLSNIATDIKINKEIEILDAGYDLRS